MKTSLILAVIASAALGSSAMAQNSGTSSETPPASGTAGTGTSAPATTGATGSSGTSSGSTMPDTASGSATPGGLSPNPSGQAASPGVPQGSGSRPGQGGWNGQPMMQGAMTCVSPAPMGGFGSFACYPAGWSMGMEMMDWHGQMHGHHRDRGPWSGSSDGSTYTPNQYYEERQSRDRKRKGVQESDGNGSSSGDDDNDWRGNSDSNDGNYGSDDYNSN